MTDEPDDKAWHLDKKVPIALIFTLLVQTGGIVWWARGVDARVEALEKAENTSAERTSQLNSIAVDMATVKEKIQSTNEDVSDIKRSVEMLTQQVLQDKSRR